MTSRAARLLRHDLRRVAQTPKTFSNWPALLAEMGRERLGRGTARPLTFVMRSGVRVSCPNRPGARLAVYEQFADDCYDLRRFLGRIVDEPMHALDIGAHVGAFACHLANMCQRATVDCFEPSASTAAYLRQNITDNRSEARVRVFESALAEEAGWAVLEDNGAGSVHNGLMVANSRLVPRHASDTVGTATRVPTSTFDDAVATAPAPVRLVKMDCEGGEYGLVYASSPDSWSSVERLVMEHHPVVGQAWDDLRGWFERIGLHVVGHRSDRPQLGTAWLSRDPSVTAGA